MAFKIEVRGTTGDEIAKFIIDGAQDIQPALSSTKWVPVELSNVRVGSTFKIQISNKAYGKSVFIRPAWAFDIVYPKVWTDWRCGKTDEDSRCGRVRKGAFNWLGEFRLTIKPGVTIGI